MQKFNFDYDPENDDLFLYSKKSKSKGSVEFGNIIFDYNSRKQVVGIQLMNASRIIKDIIGSDDDLKKFLSGLKDCHVEIKETSEMFIVRILLAGSLKKINPVISVPKITESSPALAYA